MPFMVKTNTISNLNTEIVDEIFLIKRIIREIFLIKMG